MPDTHLHREPYHLKIPSEQQMPSSLDSRPSISPRLLPHETASQEPILLPSSARFPFTLTDNARGFMLDHDHHKVEAPPNPVPGQPATTPPSRATGDHLRPLTLAILALLASPLFLVGIPLARLALSQARQHPDQARAAKILATIAIVLSYLGIVVIVVLLARHTPH